MIKNLISRLVLIAISHLCCSQKESVTPGLLREVYTKISGTYTINALKNNIKYPLNPDSYNIIDVIDTPINIGDYYGQRLRGWFLATETGSYTFYISCDNYGQLYLSNDSDSQNKVLIINQNTYTSHNQWTSFVSQASKPVMLLQSRKYYIEALMVEMTGNDSLSIGVTLPLKSSIMIAESNMLSPIHIEKCIFTTCNKSVYEECIFEKGAYELCTCVYGQKVLFNVLVCYDGVETYQDSLYIEDEFPIVRDTYITTLKTLFKEYSVSFDVKPKFFADWQNVLFWSGLLNRTHCFGNTSIFFSPNGSLCIFFALNNLFNNSFVTSSVFPLTYWTSLNISQEMFNGVYIYSLSVNETVVYSTTNMNPMVLSNVKFYAASSFYNAHVGSIRNLIITSGNYRTLSIWTSWSSCNSSCGFGLLNRSRICINNLGLNCTTKSIAEFSSCFSNKSCKGYGFINRSRLCNSANKYDCSGVENEFLNCFGSDICKVPEKPSLNVSYNGFLEGNLLSIILKVHQAIETSIYVNVVIEYFLPTFISVISENESSLQGFLKIDANRLRYIVPGLFLPSISFAHNLTVMFDDAKCPLPGVFLLEIPMTLTFHNVMGKCWAFTKRLHNSVRCINVEEKDVVKEVQALEESYGRELFWDVENSHVYVCMNQHVDSDKTACYFSNDDANLWADVDIRIGSVLGRHSKNKKLYATHRNQKTYMTFDNTNKMWLALTKEEFKDTAFYIDSFWRRSLEGNSDQVHTLGPNQWLGNAEGLFYRRQENDPWLTRAKWHQ